MPRSPGRKHAALFAVLVLGERPGQQGNEGLELPGLRLRACRHVKESFLGPQPPANMRVNLPGSGSRLIGGGVSVEVTGDEVRELLVDGFFPFVGLEERPQRRQSGFQELGLPYAPDPAVTRNLAAFLTTHRPIVAAEMEPGASHDPARPDIVLLNGGLFASPVLRERLLEVIRSWFRSDAEPAWQPRVLAGDRLDLAVARGAAYYGLVRRGVGVRISASLARSYYIGLEGDESQALCLLPGSIEPGQGVELTDRTFHLALSEPVEFPLYVSSTRMTDAPGSIVPIDPEEMRALPPIRTVLRARKRSERGEVAVRLHAGLTEIGTIELGCSEVDRERNWRLQFDVRSATQTDVAAHAGGAEAEGFFDESLWEAGDRLVRATFGPDAQDSPEGLVKRLAQALGMSRHEWPPSLLRRLWETLMDVEPGRRRSPAHEARWLNLLGYALRPGYGLAVDDWRVAETWRTVQGKLAFGAAASRTEGWILWRRIAGGLSAGQQRAVAEPLLGPLRALHRRLTTGKTGGKGKGDYAFDPQSSVEAWRLLGSLERLPVSVKRELGGMVVDLLPKRRMESQRAAMLWALGRVGAREPLHGPLNSVVPSDVAGNWLSAVVDEAGDEDIAPLVVMQLARRTDDRYRDLSDALRQRAADWLTTRAAAGHLVELVERGGRLDESEQGRLFGEALPRGLRLA